MYLKKAQSENPCLYEIPYDTSDLANRFTPDREETLTLEKESRSKLDKDLVKPYDYTKKNSLYENFKLASKEYHDQLAHENEVRKKITKKPNIVPISTRKPKSQANKSVATPPKKIVASESIIQKSKSYYRMMYEKTSKAWKWWIEQQCPSGYKWVPKTKMKWVPKTKNENVKKRVSFAIDNVSRITNVLKLTNSLGSNFSNVPSSSNSLADCLTHPIHC
ncbi:hypothetical protein Tco_0699307 [Tanacetum coccineum]